ncbi:hypothetical protein NM688_g6071 [Phlebia brevispora]|uniref:Uncharacterized protein n=1 Tax=Phlebia brevispora TaxID=194682 RepID=A0ACC1SKA6_9APHY|nr:hypothetical protein NM688_g6071 [Phlebia brevispora]
MLTFPLAMASAGIIPGMITCFFSGAVAAFGLYLLSLCAVKAPHRRASFFAIAELTFPRAAVFFDAAIAIKCFGVSISYLIIVKALMPSVVAALYHDLTSPDTNPPDWALSGRSWILLLMLILVPLSFLRKLDSLRHTSYIALFSVAYLVVIVIVCYFFPLKGTQERGEVHLIKFTPNFVSTFPVQVFAYTCSQNIFPIFNEIHENTQARMNIVIGTSIGGAAFIYEIIAIFGYLTFGSKVGANIIAMYPSTSLFIAVGQLAIAVLVMFSYPLQVHPCRNCLDKVFHAGHVLPAKTGSLENEDVEVEDEHSDSPDMTPLKHTLLTLGIIISGFTIAYFVDDLQMGKICTAFFTASDALKCDVRTVLSFVGSTGSTTISFILPGLFYWKLTRDDPELELQYLFGASRDPYGLPLKPILTFTGPLHGAFSEDGLAFPLDFHISTTLVSFPVLFKATTIAGRVERVLQAIAVVGFVHLPSTRLLDHHCGDPSLHSPSLPSSLQTAEMTFTNIETTTTAQAGPIQHNTLPTSASAPEIQAIRSLNASSVPFSPSLDSALMQSSRNSSAEALQGTSALRESGSGPSSPLETDVAPLVEALRSKDRIWLLKLADSMEVLINERRTRFDMTPSTSYQRMLVHRCSSYYKLVPETDPVTKIIWVCFRTESRIPTRRVCELVPAEESAQPAFKIMQRAPDRRARQSSQPGSVAGDEADNSDADKSETGSSATGSGKRHPTIEEREAAYNEARSRIFMDFEKKENSANSSTLSLVSGSASRSSAGDGDDAASSAATESEWSGPVTSIKRDGKRGGSSRRSGQGSYNASASGSSRNSRATSPSFQYPSPALYDPNTSTYEPVYGPQAAPPHTYMPYYYPSYPPQAPGQPYLAPYTYPYGPYGYSPPHQMPPHHSDPVSPPGGDQAYVSQPPPPMPYQQPQYMWHPPPPGQPLPQATSPTVPNANLPGLPPPPQSPPNQIPPQSVMGYPGFYPQGYPPTYPMAPFYPPPPGQPMPPPAPPSHWKWECQRHGQREP